MIWDILEQKLTTAGLGVVGTSMFRYHMPATITRGLMFKVPLVGIDVNPYMPGFYKPNLQIIVRHDDPALGEALAHQVQDAVTSETEEFYPANAERGAVRILRFYPRQLPIHFPRLDGNGFEWSLNFETAFNIDR